MRNALLASTALLALSAPAAAHNVYPGCAIPGPSKGHTFYVDPVNGKTPAAGGLGTKAAPWNSLQGIVAGFWSASLTVPGYTRPLLSSVPYNHPTPTGRVDAPDLLGSPPVAPGDTIELMSGNYGDVAIGNYNMPTTNSDFVTIKAVPGQTPVFTTLALTRTNKWLLDGIKVQSVYGFNNNKNATLVVGDQGSTYPTSDIILEHMSVSSIDDSSVWTQAEWVANARLGFNIVGTPGDGTNGEPYTTCISMTGSHIFNTRVAGAWMVNNSVFSRNEIDHFGDDGLDIGSSNILITENYIHDNLDIGDGNHEDGIQGQLGPMSAGVAVNHFSNIVVDSNLVIRQTDPDLKFPTYLQAIDAFDADWTNLKVTNNVVITSSCYALEWSSAHNALIAGNSGLWDPTVASPGCGAAFNIGGKSHTGLDSSNLRINNNLGDHFFVNDQN